MPAQISKTAELIAGYSLQERIGSGGYGEVWRAEAPGGLLKAIKFIYGRFDEERASYRTQGPASHQGSAASVSALARADRSHRRPTGHRHGIGRGFAERPFRSLQSRRACRAFRARNCCSICTTPPTRSIT